jgi:hypothetical protein
MGGSEVVVAALDEGIGGPSSRWLARSSWASCLGGLVRDSGGSASEIRSWRFSAMLPR